MKTLFLSLSLLLLSAQASASHFVQCELEAKVTAVKNLARLDGVAIFGRHGAPNDHEQTVGLTVTKILRVEGRDRSCLPVGSQHTLAVKTAQIGQYVVGQTVKVAYRNVGDARASRISWDVRP